MISKDYKYEATKVTEKVQRAIVWMMPRWVIRWATVRSILHATNGKWNTNRVYRVAAVDVLKRWDESNEQDQG